LSLNDWEFSPNSGGKREAIFSCPVAMSPQITEIPEGLHYVLAPLQILLKRLDRLVIGLDVAFTEVFSEGMRPSTLLLVGILSGFVICRVASHFEFTYQKWQVRTQCVLCAEISDS
jgi:hypothetical protein